MNRSQELWWRQAQSDLSVLRLLERAAASPCHQLHYVQMVTEKLAKAYLWRSGAAPPKSHAGFVQFLRFLGSVRSSERRRVAKVFKFRRFDDFRNWIRSVLPLAYALERLAPALAQDNSPNPEYPWPRMGPQFAPAMYEFEIWNQLTQTGQGRQLLLIIEDAVAQFPTYA